MFCPICSKENSLSRKFCVACGTNLEAVSQALSGNKTDFFTKTDAALDQLIAKYAEHVFKDAPMSTAETSIGKSWKILGQGVLTSIMDLILFSLMMNIFPIRFLILLISSPIRLLYGRSNRHKINQAEIDEHPDFRLIPSATIETIDTLPQPVASISEQTTEKLEAQLQQKQRQS